MVIIFKANNPQNTFLLFLYGLLLKMAWFIDPITPRTHTMDSDIWKELILFLNQHLREIPVIFSVISFTLLFVQAIALNQMMSRGRMLPKPNYLPAMSFLLLTSFFPSWNVLSSAMVCNTIMLWVIAKLFFVNTDNNPKTTLFNLGFFIAMCAIFQFYFVLLALLIYAALVLKRPFRLPEWLSVLFGIFTLSYLLLGWMFLNDSIYTFSLPDMHWQLPSYHQYFNDYWLLALIILLSLTGIFVVQGTSGKQIVRVRRDWVLLTFYFFLALLIALISGAYNFQYFVLIMLPAAALVGSLFSVIKKKWVAATLHWLLIAIVFYLQYVENNFG